MEAAILVNILQKFYKYKSSCFPRAVSTTNVPVSSRLWCRRSSVSTWSPTAKSKLFRSAKELLENIYVKCFPRHQKSCVFLREREALDFNERNISILFCHKSIEQYLLSLYSDMY